MKKLILTLTFALGLGSIAEAQQFKSLNMLREVVKIGSELQQQSTFLVNTVRSEGDKDGEAVCYALGTLHSSRKRLAESARFLGRSASALQGQLATITQSANQLAEVCSERVRIEGASTYDKRKSDRARLASQIQQAADQIPAIIEAGIRN